jgi:signal transduction histidine kinase
MNLYTEVNYHIINGDYKQALRLADWLSPDTCAERKAIIYHRMGNNEKAYEYMALYKHLSDSIARVSHSNVVSNLYLRMNNDRLRLERELLTHKNAQLRYRTYIAAGIIFILVLLFFIYQRHRIIRLLRKDNQMLNYSKEGAERALEEVNELSFYESKTELPLTSTVKINKLCNRLTGLTQERCNKGVTATFQTEFDDDFEIWTNSDALEKLLTHLLTYSARFTHKGSVIMKCADSGQFVRFSVTDTSLGLGNKPKDLLSGIFNDRGNTVRYIGMNFNICQSITRLLHGRIWHDVAYTKGTRFCVEIPKEPQ